MKMIYVSHPFSGNENQNRKMAREKIAKLSEEFPNIVFINPLDNMQYAEQASLSYDDILKQCIRLLDSCDGLVMLGDWKNSKGCVEEYKEAVHVGITVYDENLKVLEF